VVSQDNANFFIDNSSAKRLQAGPRTGFTTLVQASYVDLSKHTFAALNDSVSFYTPLLGANQDNLTGSIFGVYGVVESRHAAGTRVDATGFGADAFHTVAGGTVTNLTGGNVYVECSAGTCTTVRGIDVQTIVGGGTIGTLVGVNVRAQTATSTDSILVNLGNVSGGATSNDIIKVGTGRLNFGSATSLLLPNSAGAAPTVSGHVAYDTTPNDLEYGDNGTNRKVANLDEAQTLSGPKTLTAPVIADYTAAAHDHGDADDAGALVAAAYAAVTATLTEKTIDCEASGNVCRITNLLSFVAGVIQSSTVGGACSKDPTLAYPAGTDASGTNTGYATLSFDAATDEGVGCLIPLPIGFAGTVDLDVMWRAASTSGDVIWAIQTICIADAETGDPAFNTASTVTDTAKGTTLQFNTANITTVTITGCVANEIMMARLYRDANAGGDTMTGDAQLISFRLTTRRDI
jgi:hypothetical protein